MTSRCFELTPCFLPLQGRELGRQVRVRGQPNPLAIEHQSKRVLR
jgi:hypothetical protein